MIQATRKMLSSFTKKYTHTYIGLKKGTLWKTKDGASSRRTLMWLLLEIDYDNDC